MKARRANVSRKTRETDINVTFTVGGNGTAKARSGSGFFDHMLELFARHGLFDLALTCKGDKQVDMHHSIEDIGLCLGSAVDKALGDRAGIRRYGFAELPMDEALASAVVDLGGRPYLVYNVRLPRKKANDFDSELAEEFFRAVSTTGRMNIHIDLVRGKNLHHCLEAIFKAFGRALDQATQVDLRRKNNIPSTKGII